jgi:cellulose synthase/poly-beta-1,6-N-acetylglucosamine synthase-like glycosyltransferase
MLAALLPDRSEAKLSVSPDSPKALILVPARNEADTLPALLAAIDQLVYPPDRLHVLLIDDGSTDDSAGLMTAWAKTRQNRQVLRLTQNIGKALALNAGLTQVTIGEIIVVYDADVRPLPESLGRLLAPFACDSVGAVSGRRAVCNALASPAATYTTFEGLVHQLVTTRAKDRLHLAPPILGANCAYRRAALADVGAFKPGVLLEDSDLSVKLPRAGWQIRFVSESISYHAVPETLTGYWRQHTRWARGFNEVARDQAGSLMADQTLPFLLRLELMIFSAGYLDRLAFALAGGLLLLKKRTKFPGWVMTLSLLTPLLQTMAALRVMGAPRSLWLRLIWLPLFFGLDLAMAAVGMWTTLKRAPQLWEERRLRS